MVTRIRAPRPVFDYSGGEVGWWLTIPPHGVNHAKELAKWGPTPHIYKRRESKLWEVYVKGRTGGWVPPPKTPLVVVMTFYVPKAEILMLDVDKWAPIVVDAVVGSRYDQWVFRCTSDKAETMDGEGPNVSVRVSWALPAKGRRKRG